MQLAKKQIVSGLRALALGLAQTVPTFLLVVWLLSETVGWGFRDMLAALAASQPVGPLLELITGA